MKLLPPTGPAVYAAAMEPPGIGAPNSVASGDFTNIATNNAADGVYTLNGVPCAIGDIIDLESPLNDFDPIANIDEDGIKPTDLGGGSWSGVVLPLAEPLNTSLITNGFTLVLEIFSPEPNGGVQVAPHDDGFSTDTNCDFETDRTWLHALDGQEYWYGDHGNVPLIATGAISKVALTMTSARTACSIDGSAVAAVESGCIGPVIDLIQFNCGADSNGLSRFRSFAFYEVVDDADLPTLSS